jgi:hypothetical protein
MQTKRSKPSLRTVLRPGHVYPVNLNQAAEALGCSKVHLSLVLRKKRTSPSLTAAYAELVTQQRKAAA